MGYVGVVEAFVQQPDDRPTLGYVVQLAKRAQVAKEGLGLVDGLKAQDGLHQLGRRLIAPGFRSAHCRPRKSVPAAIGRPRHPGPVVVL